MWKLFKTNTELLIWCQQWIIDVYAEIANENNYVRRLHEKIPLNTIRILEFPKFNRRGDFERFSVCT